MPDLHQGSGGGDVAAAAKDAGPLGDDVTRRTLDQALRDLDVDPTPETCHAARALFAKVLDLPGGMRIGTIHAFSQSLLAALSAGGSDLAALSAGR